MLLLQFSTSFLNSACLAAKKSVGQRKKSSVIISPPIYKRKSNIFGSTLFILLFTVFFRFCSFAVFAFVLWVLQFYLHFIFEALFVLNVEGVFLLVLCEEWLTLCCLLQRREEPMLSWGNSSPSPPVSPSPWLHSNPSHVETAASLQPVPCPETPGMECRDPSPR